MKFLIVDTFYHYFLNSFYAQNPVLVGSPYSRQWRALMDQCFGTADFYSHNLHLLGHEATEVIANCEHLQRQWAEENGVDLEEPKWRWKIDRRAGFLPWPKRIQSEDWLYDILTVQVKHYHPDILYIQDMNSTPSCFLQETRPHVRLVVGQIGCPISPKIDFKQYDLVLSSLPYYVERFRNKGLKSELFRLGFERTISDRLMKKSSPYPVVHVGSYDSLHQERNKLLEALIEHGIPLGCWGFGIEHLSVASPIHRCYQGEAWGLKMYNIRHNSLIVVTKHISSVAKGHAAMMTLFEATGVGSLLVIDHAKDLPILFEPGKELVAYRTPNECAELIQYYLEHDKEREAIAKAGQQRTLKEHTFYHRMQELLEIVRKCL